MLARLFMNRTQGQVARQKSINVSQVEIRPDFRRCRFPTAESMREEPSTLVQNEMQGSHSQLRNRSGGFSAPWE
jgi:hypothetical protein